MIVIAIAIVIVRKIFSEKGDALRRGRGVVKREGKESWRMRINRYG